ncbi:hypothetical protein ACYOEI_11255 [Singulisphaera rosea]
MARDLDARDIVSEGGSYPFPYHVRPTLWQYTFDLGPAGLTMLVCTLAGVFAASACFVTMKDQTLGITGVAVRLLGLLFPCFAVTMVITALHTPSHH